MNDQNRYWTQRDFIVDLLKQLPAHVFWKDRNSIYLGCNDIFARAFGFLSPDEIIGKSDYDLPIKKEQSDAFRQDDKEVMESREPKLNIQEEQIFPDGRKVFLLTSKVPLVNQENEIMGILGIYYDITELKKNKS
jgi:two-component system, OmpR family, aerobic respiration control sensor histidine kinase ArcB